MESHSEIEWTGDYGSGELEVQRLEHLWFDQVKHVVFDVAIEVQIGRALFGFSHKERDAATRNHWHQRKRVRTDVSADCVPYSESGVDDAAGRCVVDVEHIVGGVAVAIEVGFPLR